MLSVAEWGHQTDLLSTSELNSISLQVGLGLCPLKTGTTEGGLQKHYQGYTRRMLSFLFAARGFDSRHIHPI